ncbi:hypothetical protein C368_00434 [Cryptococcus neoformans 125.91]|nr:hypothetical protein C368_00434 [Cryptococcus neoformans var. grubii 125.91]
MSRGGECPFGGVYPEVGGWVWGWVKDGGEGAGMGGWGGQSRMVEEQSTGQSAVPRRPPPLEWIWDERFRRWMRVPSLSVRPSVPVKSRMMAHRHVLALREFQPSWYSPQKPRLILSLVVIAFIILLIIILVGHFLKCVYTIESTTTTTTVSGGSSGDSNKLLPTWVERELRKRKDEKPEETSKRVGKEDKADKDRAERAGKEEFEKWGKKRDKEKGMLRKELEKRKMPLTGLDGLEDDDGKKDKKKDEGKREKGGKKEEKDMVSEEGETKEKRGKGSKIKKLLLGEKTDKIKGTDGTWEPADPNVAEVTIASSTANAQKEAERLKAGG